MKKINFLFAFALLCGLFAARDTFSQSMSWEDGAVFATQKGRDGFEITGSTFRLKDNRLLEFKNGQLREDFQQGSYKKEGNEIRYYNNDELLVGCYVPAEGRFFSVSVDGVKKALSAYAKDGHIHKADDKPVCRYDPDFDPVFMGFILFFFLGYTA